MALQLLNNILTPQFIVYLVELEIITALMHQVSSGLQKVGIDIVGAIQQIDNLLVSSDMLCVQRCKFLVVRPTM